MNLKKFLFIKLPSLPTILLISFVVVLMVYGLIFIQTNIIDTLLFASSMRLMEEIKYAQIVAMLKEENLQFTSYNDGKRFAIIYENSKQVHYDDAPYFSVKITIKSIDGNKDIGFFKIKSGGYFEPEAKIILTKQKLTYSLTLLKDGKIFLSQNK